MPIQAVNRYIQFASYEPLIVGTIKIRIEDFVPFGYPLIRLCLMRPESRGIRHSGLAG
jgi:hypothetical protein